MLQTSEPDTSMYGALPPGAWWEVANGANPVAQPYGPEASDEAVNAAREGDLQLRVGMYVLWPSPEAVATMVLRHMLHVL